MDCLCGDWCVCLAVNWLDWGLRLALGWRISRGLSLDWKGQIVGKSSSVETLRSVLYSILVPRLRAGLVPRLVVDWYDLCQSTANWCQLSLLVGSDMGYPKLGGGLSVCELVSDWRELRQGLALDYQIGQGLKMDW